MTTPERAVATVLVVDDSEINRDLLVRQLARLGYPCVSAASGADALKLWSPHSIALVLTDLRMPGIDGHALAARIRAAEAGSGRRVPIIAVSANVAAGSARDAGTGDIDALVAKPIDIARLRQVLERWLGGHVGESQPKPPALAAASAPGVLDLAVIAGIVGDDPVFVSEALAGFRAHALAVVAELAAALAADDLARVEAAAHQLSSSAAAVGARVLSTACTGVEHAAARSDRQAVGAGTARIEHHLRAVLAVIADQPGAAGGDRA